MAVSIRDNLSPIQTSPQPVVRNDVGHSSFTLTIDGKTVQAYENQTLLSVAVDNGITDIPNMCNDEKLEPTATCRMCLVHIEGVKQPLPSCTTPALPGMVVTTKSDELFTSGVQTWRCCSPTTMPTASLPARRIAQRISTFRDTWN